MVRLQSRPSGPGALLPVAAFLCLLGGCSAKTQEAPAERPSYGAIVMAHGGKPEWNRAILEAVAAVPADYPIEVAFGMADAVSIQEAVERLEQRGVRQIGVVRLFISGESWYERTREILGLARGAPPRPTPAAGETVNAAAPAGHRMEYWRVRTASTFAVSTQGLSEEPAVGEILADRARAMSHDPASEDLLVLAHGPGDDRENQRWIERIEGLARRIDIPFRRVAVMTLREDWPEKRTLAESAIRSYVQRATAERGRAIVVPFRVFGFGPYAGILEGTTYTSDGRGLLPHPIVARWIHDQAESLRRGPFHAPEPAAAHAIGERLGEYRLSGVQGEERRLSAFHGEKATVLYFWSASCPCVPQVEERVQAAIQRFPPSAGVGFVAIDSHPDDRAEDVRRALADLKSSYPMLLDPTQTVARALGVDSAVTFVVLDAERRLRYRGGFDDDLLEPRKAHLLDALEAVLAGKNPDPAETAGAGCPYPGSTVECPLK